MKNDAERRKELTSIFDQIRSTCQGLLETLTAERDAITRRDIDAITTWTQTKHSQLVELESLEIKRIEVFKALGWNHDTPDAEPLVAAVWGEIIKHLAACQEANQINGALLRTQQNQTQQTFDLLTGGSKQATTYQSDGLANPLSKSHTIARA